MTSDDGFDEFYQSAFGRLVGQVYLVTSDLGVTEARSILAFTTRQTLQRALEQRSGGRLHLDPASTE